MDETPRDGILLRDGALIYYGNPAGRLEGEGVTADPIFRRRELEEWLEGQGLPVRWEEGVYDELCQERIPVFRIWQLRPEVPLRFPVLTQLQAAYGEPLPRLLPDGLRGGTKKPHLRGAVAGLLPGASGGSGASPVHLGRARAAGALRKPLFLH